MVEKLRKRFLTPYCNPGSIRSPSVRPFSIVLEWTAQPLVFTIFSIKYEG
jgi:hypothetical protein